MKVIITKDYATLSELTAGIVLEKMMESKRVNLSLTAGSTPEGMYRILLDKLSKIEMDTSLINYYNFDEVPLENERYGLTMSTLNEDFYGPAKIAKENIHELNLDNYHTFSRKIIQDGGIDLIVMGIGADGHFCGNMPGTTGFDKDIYSVELVPGSDGFQLVEKITGKTPGPETVTFGPKTVMGAKQLVLIANGEAKAKIIKQVLEGPVTEEVPSSILTTHPNITVILDQEAAQYLNKDLLR